MRCSPWPPMHIFYSFSTEIVHGKSDLHRYDERQMSTMTDKQTFRHSEHTLRNKSIASPK